MPKSTTRHKILDAAQRLLETAGLHSSGGGQEPPPTDDRKFVAALVATIVRGLAPKV